MDRSSLSDDAIAASGDLGGDDDPSEWSFVLAPYGWLLNLDGDVSIRGREADIKQSFSDLLKQISFVAEARFEAWNGDWGFTVDPTFALLTEEARVAGLVDVDLETSMFLMSAGAARRLYENAIDDTRSLRIDATAGVIYVGLSSELDLPSPLRDPDFSEGWFDPYIGGRGTFDVSENLKLRIAGLIGGFGIGEASDFSWVSELLLGFRISDSSRLWGGYRALGIEWDQGSGNRELEFDVLLHGPVAGISFAF